jgi:hypothetical protein
MKSGLLLAAVAATGAIAKPHGHIHKRLSHTHNHQKKAVTEEIVTVTVCKLGPLELPESVCDFYVNKGVLKYVDDGQGGAAVALAKTPPAASAVSQLPFLSQYQ